MQDEVRAYTFSDFLTMKPGTVVGGFLKVDDMYRLGPSWSLPEGSNRRLSRSFQFVFEHDAEWRRKFRQHSSMVGTSRVYSLPQIPFFSIKTFPISTLSPVGIYLGHIVRFDSCRYVNVLLGEGYDVWIRCH
jgi:hypothetical protein